MDLKKYLNDRKKLVDRSLPVYLPDTKEFPPSLHKAMHYSVFAGGKRFRPILVMAAAEAVGGQTKKVMAVACAFELIHTYSLIHDDLPCMDDDDFRRGKPTCHKKFGEAVALLAGDALLTQAFYVLAKEAAELPGQRQKNAMQAISGIGFAAGSKGMVGGQVADVENEGKTISLPVLQYIHTHKTGAMIKEALKAGAAWAGASAGEIGALAQYGEKMGLAFQISDDILNVVGQDKAMGKKTGTDAARKKATYPAFYGLADSYREADLLVNQAKVCLKRFSPKRVEPLRHIADYLVRRQS